MPPITAPQLRKINVLYGQLAGRDLTLDKTRETRLRWATNQLATKQPIASFGKLTSDQARRLIDAASGALGLAFPAPRPYSCEQARRRGLEGRHDDQEFVNAPQLVSTKQLEELARLGAELGMDQERIDKFIAARSPFGRGRTIIRTSAEANKVRFALLGMVRARSKQAKADN